MRAQHLADRMQINLSNQTNAAHLHKALVDMHEV